MRNFRNVVIDDYYRNELWDLRLLVVATSKKKTFQYYTVNSSISHKILVIIIMVTNYPLQPLADVAEKIC